MSHKNLQNVGQTCHLDAPQKHLNLKHCQITMSTENLKTILKQTNSLTSTKMLENLKKLVQLAKLSKKHQLDTIQCIFILNPDDYCFDQIQELEVEVE